MIQILFIIDFLENIISVIPKGNDKEIKKKFKKILKQKIEKCVKGCSRQNQRFLNEDEIEFNKILAISPDQKYIVGTIIDSNNIPERVIWETINEVCRNISMINIENNDDLKELKKDILVLVDRANQKNFVQKTLDSSQQSLEKMGKLQNKQQQQALKIMGTLKKAEKNKEQAKETETIAVDFEKEAYWYEKKLFIFMMGLIVLVSIIILIWFMKIIGLIQFIMQKN